MDKASLPNKFGALAYIPRLKHGGFTHRLRKIGELYRRDKEVHQLQLLERTEIIAELNKIGFGVQVLESYGQLQFPPEHIGLLAEKI